MEVRPFTRIGHQELEGKSSKREKGSKYNRVLPSIIKKKRGEGIPHRAKITKTPIIGLSCLKP